MQLVLFFAGIIKSPSPSLEIAGNTIRDSWEGEL